MKKDKESTLYLKNLGEKIVALRKKRGITQAELAKSLGTEHPQIGRLERGETNCTILVLRRIAFELDVSISELVDISMKKK